MKKEDGAPTPRVMLPKNLPATLRGLDDLELETLQREVAAEIKDGAVERRRRLLPPSPARLP